MTAREKLGSPISVYVSRDLIKWVDQRVKEGMFRNRSHAFERGLQLLRDGGCQ